MMTLAIGIAFGFFLERAGMGNSRKLAGQFYLTDLTVFKVMFSAIVTAALGLFWLNRLHVLDLATIEIPPTYVMPQAMGGLMFGLGFVVAGLCPGTSCVAAAAGRVDGAAVIGGMFAGVFLFEGLFSRIERFYESTYYGPQTLDQITSLSRASWTLVLTLIALSGFAAAEWYEKRR